MIKFLLLVYSIFLLIFSLSCSNDSADRENNINSNILDDTEDSIVKYYSDILNNAENQYGYNISNDYILIVNTTEQIMYLIRDNIVVNKYIISTGKTGEGNISGSGQTPLGYHKILEKIGDDAPIGAIFVARVYTEKVSPIYTDKTDLEEDHVVTRILTLDGLEEGYNKGGNVDSKNRYIYIHGTPEEGLLGEKHSHGCIRMDNNDVIDLFNTIEKNTIVYITQ